MVLQKWKMMLTRFTQYTYTDIAEIIVHTGIYFVLLSTIIPYKEARVFEC